MLKTAVILLVAVTVISSVMAIKFTVSTESSDYSVECDRTNSSITCGLDGDKDISQEDKGNVSENEAGWLGAISERFSESWG